MHTPEQAEELWCPMVRMDGSNWSGDRGEDVDYNTCIADKCSMWRWEPKLLFAKKQTGYCGLAGSPAVAA